VVYSKPVINRVFTRNFPVLNYFYPRRKPGQNLVKRDLLGKFCVFCEKTRFTPGIVSL
jgi:hypothetical protein